MSNAWSRHACAVALALAAHGTFAAAAVPAPAARRVVLLVPVDAAPSWRDDLFLIAVPAAVVRGTGEPVVCAVRADAPWRPELVDFLRRYEPERVVWLGPDAPDEAPLELPLDVIPADSVGAAARAVAAACWSRSARAVSFDPADRAGAQAAAVLAARLGTPLFPVDCDGLGDALHGLGVKTLLAVGARPAADFAGVRVEHLEGPLQVAAHLAGTAAGVDYLAVVHPHDGGVGGAPRLSFAGVLLAAGRWIRRAGRSPMDRITASGTVEPRYALRDVPGPEFV